MTDEQLQEYVIDPCRDGCGCDCDRCRASAMANELLALRAEVKALRWQKITPENLPKVGNEVLDCFGDVQNVVEEWEWQMWDEHDYTHFRPINPPLEGADDGE